MKNLIIFIFWAMFFGSSIMIGQLGLEFLKIDTFAGSSIMLIALLVAVIPSSISWQLLTVKKNSKKPLKLFFFFGELRANF